MTQPSLTAGQQGERILPVLNTPAPLAGTRLDIHRPGETATPLPSVPSLEPNELEGALVTASGMDSHNMDDSAKSDNLES